MQIIIGLVTIFIICIGLLLFKHLKENTGPPPQALTEVAGFLMNNVNSIFLVLLFIFGVIVVASIYDWNFNPEVTKEITNEITYENLNNMEESFCDAHKTKTDLKPSCGELSETNCNSVGCCVFLNNEKCVPGNKHGPVHLGTEDNLIKIDNYFFKNKCYGNC